MYQGTTPTHKFKLNIDTDEISKIRILYAQNKSVLLEKTENDVEYEDGWVVLKLTQEETFLFNKLSPITIQLRVLTKGNDALVSNNMNISLYECLSDEVL